MRKGKSVSYSNLVILIAFTLAIFFILIFGSVYRFREAIDAIDSDKRDAEGVAKTINDLREGALTSEELKGIFDR